MTVIRIVTLTTLTVTKVINKQHWVIVDENDTNFSIHSIAFYNDGNSKDVNGNWDYSSSLFARRNVRLVTDSDDDVMKSTIIAIRRYQGFTSNPTDSGP